MLFIFLLAIQYHLEPCAIRSPLASRRHLEVISSSSPPLHSSPTLSFRAVTVTYILSILAQYATGWVLDLPRRPNDIRPPWRAHRKAPSREQFSPAKLSRTAQRRGRVQWGLGSHETEERLAMPFKFAAQVLLYRTSAAKEVCSSLLLPPLLVVSLTHAS
jgi:hypothetical protein